MNLDELNATEDCLVIRSKTPTLQNFIAESPWAKNLTMRDLERVLATTRERVYQRNASIVNTATAAQYWVGLIDGFVVQSVTHSDGHVSFLSAVSGGAWFGEGTLLKRARWGYDAVVLRESRAALIPLETFEWLHHTSLTFNHFLEALLNNRLSHFIGLLVTSRHTATEGRVATVLANLFNTGSDARDRFVCISQGELAMLAGTSRQRVNEALKRLHELGLVQPRRQGVDVLDLDGLRSFVSAQR